jgi:hypothetical protein
MDSLSPAPGSAVTGAPPALRRPLTPEDGVQVHGPFEDRGREHSPVSTHPQHARATRPSAASHGGHEPSRGADSTTPLSSYLPAFGLLCAAAAVWLGTRRRRPATTN